VASREEFLEMKRAGITGFDISKTGSNDKMVKARPAPLSRE
jgi:hypothetical protein